MIGEVLVLMRDQLNAYLRGQTGKAASDAEDVLPQEGMLPGAWLALVPGYRQFQSWSRAVGMWAKAAAVGHADAQRRVVHGRRRCAARRIVHMSIALPFAQMAPFFCSTQA